MARADLFGLEAASEDRIDELIAARQVMDTECDCLIQTPSRLIVIECKDKTGFHKEQRDRQKQLFECLKRLLPRDRDLLYIELSPKPSENPDTIIWTWAQIAELAGRCDCA
jgi:hypothetical protein